MLDWLNHTPQFNRWAADVLRPYLGDRVLEIGAGTGNMSVHLTRQHPASLGASTSFASAGLNGCSASDLSAQSVASVFLPAGPLVYQLT
jgi:ubiquinone/menaquinone biosynthesis C-methylase UbiE